MYKDTQEVFPKELVAGDWNDFYTSWLKSTKCVNSQKENTSDLDCLL